MKNLMTRMLDIVEGDCSGKVECTNAVTLNGKKTAKALIEQGSDPEFFQLDENGDDSDGEA